MYLLDGGVRFEELRDAHGVFGLRADAPGQGVDAAKGQPAIERRRHAAAIALRLAGTLEEVIVVTGDERAADDVAVAADVFRGGVGHHVDAAIERLLEDGSGEGAVANGEDVGTAEARHGGDRRQVGDLHQGIGRGFDPDQAGVGAQGGVEIVDAGHVDVAGFEAPLAEDLADYFTQAPVDVVGRDDVVAGFESLDEGGGYGESGGETEGLFAAFEGGETFLERMAVGIVLARVAVPARIFAVGSAFEGGGKVDGRGHCSGGGVDMAPRVDGPGLNLHHCTV